MGEGSCHWSRSKQTGAWEGELGYRGASTARDAAELLACSAARVKAEVFSAASWIDRES